MKPESEATPQVGDVVMITISELGGLGDGVGKIGDRPVFVPYTMAGDFVSARIVQANKKIVRAELLEVLEPSEHRVPAPCPHFATCGGCDLQHLPEEQYADFKQAQLVEAVSRAGFDPACVRPVLSVGPNARRRATLRVVRRGQRVLLGYYQRRSHKVVDVSACPLLVPELEKLLDPLRLLVARLGPGAAIDEITLTRADNGIDILLISKRNLRKEVSRRLTAWVREQRIMQMRWKKSSEVTEVFSSAVPTVSIAGYKVRVPTDAFLQPTATGQQIIADLVTAAAADSTRVYDLYAGLGAWTLPLLTRGHIVEAWEGDQTANDELQRAVKGPGAERLKVHTRDLYRQPVQGEALLGVDAAVVNPPRTGAEPQIAALAVSEVPLVILISCNPRALERDARHLADNRYHLVSSVPVDQFHWSVHLESVSVFRKDERIG